MAREHKKIQKGMTDRERYKILKNRTLTVVPVDETKLQSIGNETLVALSGQKVQEAKPILRKLAEEFGVLKEYENADIELSFTYSKNGLNESIQKQKAHYDDFAKMLTCFDGVVQNAVGIEVHDDRYNVKSDLKGVYVLVGAFRDGANVVPVKLEIKEQSLGAGNKLYIAITESKIKKTGFHGVRRASALTVTFPQPVSTISISQLAKNINPSDGNFLKYFPDRMLDKQQRETKKAAANAEKEYIERKMKDILQRGSAKAPMPSHNVGPASPKVPTELKMNVRTQRKTPKKTRRGWGL